MRTMTDVSIQFGYHPATKETAVTHDSLRGDYYAFAASIWDRIPDGPEKTIVLRKLQESLMYANLAVAMTAPMDTDTSAVARVLPSH